MKISVITAVYNGEQFIRQTIESILTQTGDFELEYIIRDGCSTDDTLKIIAEYQHDSRLTVISAKDGGPQEAINNGMAMATGDIGCWLNADDLYEPGALQLVATTFTKYPAVQWLYGRCAIIDEHSKETRKPITWYKNMLGYFYSHNMLLCENYINQPATFWRINLWAKTNNLNPNYKAAWDYELWLKMAHESPAMHIRKYLAKFRRHGASISENNFEQQFNEELAIAATYGNWCHHLIHKFNAWKIKLIYRLLAAKKILTKDCTNQHTFVIPAYGESSFIEACIRSLQQQTVKSQIIIATSTPSLYLTNIANKYNIPLCINKCELNIANDWNFALSSATTEYCTLAHQDDIYLPQYTEKMLKSALKTSSSSIIFCDYSELKDDIARRWLPYLIVKRLLLLPFYVKPNWQLKFIKLFILKFGCPICCPSVLFNLKNLEKFRFSNKYSINLDWDAWLRTAKNNGSFVFVANNLVEHRISAEAETNKGLNDNRRQAEDLKLFQRIWFNPMAKLLAMLYSICYKQSKVK